MKILKLIFICQLIVINLVYASTVEGIYVPLQYDNHYLHTHKNSLKSDDYLAVNPEVTLFPKNEKQLEKFTKAISLLEKVLNSNSFKKRVLAYKRQSNGVREFQKAYLWKDSSKRLTNEQVLKVILEGNEKMRPHTEGEMNINSYVKVCKWWEKVGVWCRKVIGSTSPSSTRWIKLNWKFYSKYEVPHMVNNLVHEWIHLLGFLHGSDHMREEVPYVVGKIAGVVAQEFLDQEKENKLALK